MKIPKAIEILSGQIKEPLPWVDQNLRDATLKRILKEREIEKDPGWGHLASETIGEERTF